MFRAVIVKIAGLSSSQLSCYKLHSPRWKRQPHVNPAAFASRPGPAVLVNFNPIWAPDTSAIDWLADHRDSGALAAGLPPRTCTTIRWLSMSVTLTRIRKRVAFPPFEGSGKKRLHRTQNDRPLRVAFVQSITRASASCQATKPKP